MRWLEPESYGPGSWEIPVWKAARAVKESTIFNVLEGLYANGISQAVEGVEVWLLRSIAA